MLRPNLVLQQVKKLQLPNVVVAEHNSRLLLHLPELKSEGEVHLPKPPPPQNKLKKGRGQTRGRSAATAADGAVDLLPADPLAEERGRGPLAEATKQRKTKTKKVGGEPEDGQQQRRIKLRDGQQQRHLELRDNAVQMGIQVQMAQMQLQFQLLEVSDNALQMQQVPVVELQMRIRLPLHKYGSDWQMTRIQACQPRAAVFSTCSRRTPWRFFFVIFPLCLIVVVWVWYRALLLCCLMLLFSSLCVLVCVYV